LAPTLQIHDVSVCLEDDGEGAPLLLLHGFPATRHLWSHVAPRLVSAGFRVLVPDLVGYGDSEAPAGVRIDMASQAGWMLEMLERLGAVRPVVIAHDVGSAAAQLMVINMPERIRGLVVLDGVCESEWAMDAIASIQAWAPADARRLYPVLARRLAKSAALREMLAAYQGEEEACASFAPHAISTRGRPQISASDFARAVCPPWYCGVNVMSSCRSRRWGSRSRICSTHPWSSYQGAISHRSIVRLRLPAPSAPSLLLCGPELRLGSRPS
jgi:pimeloyl-ACP methyl ester carboxylesterase